MPARVEWSGVEVASDTRLVAFDVCYKDMPVECR